MAHRRVPGADVRGALGHRSHCASGIEPASLIAVGQVLYDEDHMKC